jgi:MscS family membrane protein
MIKQIGTIVLIILIGTACVQAKSPAVDTSFSSPFATIYNHLFYLQNDSYQPVQSARSFDPDIVEKDAIEYAIKLKQILDGKGLFVQMSKVPEKPDYKDTTLDKKLYYLFPEALPEVYVEYKNDRWQYGEETVAAIPKLHSKTYPLGTAHLLNLVSGTSSKTFWGLSSWQYLGILLIVVLGFIAFFLLRLILRPVLRKIGRMSFHIDLENKKLLNRTSHVLSLLIVFFVLKLIFPVLQLPVKWTLFTKRALEIIITVFIALLLLRILEYTVNYFKSIAEKTESKMDDQLIPIVSQILKLVIIGVTAFQVLHLMNVNVAALIAGISIGGLALALAAKDTVNNLIGSLMIFLDKPFQIGDFIEVDGNMGTVTEVGFRTTRIQKVDTAIISIPNGTIANTVLNNMGIRVFRLFHISIGVTYDTPADLIEVFVDGLRKLSVDHPRVINTDQYIHMSGFGDSSLNIMYRVYLDTRNYAEELALKEEISLAILRMADAIGIRFAFPSSTLYIEEFPGRDSLVPNYPDRTVFQEKLEEYFKTKQE